MIFMIRSLAAVVLACAALAGCSGGVTPPPVPIDLFTLSAPTVMQSQSMRIELQSDVLSLFAGGVGRREYRQHVDYVSPELRDGTVDVREEYGYRIQGTTLELFAECNDTGNCAPGPHMVGEVTASGLELRTTFDPGVVLRYRRVP
jgi:hypothetical protein